MDSFAKVHDDLIHSLSQESLADSESPDFFQTILSWCEDIPGDVGGQRQRTLKTSEKDCLALKDLGIKAYQKKNYPQALACYSNLIECCCSMQGGKNELRDLLRQAYANRSLVLQKTGSWTLCLGDVEAALEFSREPQSEYLLLDRKAKCLNELGRKSDANVAFKEAMEAAESNAPPRLKEVFTSQIEASLENLRRDISKEEEAKKKSALEELVNFERSKQFRSLSAKVQCDYAGSERGRVVIAKTDIEPGEVLACESPIISVPDCSQDSSGRIVSTACHHCLDPVDPLVFYPSPVINCSAGFRFCSWRCLQIAMEQYHKHEAPVLEEFLLAREDLSSGSVALALRAVIRTPPTQLLSPVPDEDYCFGTKETDVVEESCIRDEWRFLRSLVGHANKSSEEERITAAVRSAALVKCLKSSGYFDREECRSLDEPTVMKNLYWMQFAVARNRHTVYKMDGDISGNIPLSAVGSAVYRATVLINHSCCPNTIKYYHGGKMILVAREHISAGREITNNYGVHHWQIPRKQRRERLLSDYKFSCKCDACEEDFPLLHCAPSQMPNKKSTKTLKRLLSSYKQSFAEGDFASALVHCQEFLHALLKNQIRYPHTQYEIGVVAMNSCWWALIGVHMQQ